mgnify:FL=1
MLADTILGLSLTNQEPSVALRVVPQAELPADVAELMLEREEARKNKDFVRADSCRNRIHALGYDITDGPNGPEATKRPA